VQHALCRVEEIFLKKFERSGSFDYGDNQKKTRRDHREQLNWEDAAKSLFGATRPEAEGSVT
jgi:hypothetical protein